MKDLGVQSQWNSVDIWLNFYRLTHPPADRPSERDDVRVDALR